MGLLSDATDAAIARMINSYVAAAYGRTGKTGPELVSEAFGDIQRARQASCLLDEVTVSAEHYLFARHIVADNPVLVTMPGLVAMVCAGYDAAKIVGLKKQVTDCPTSDYSTKHTRWKMHGISAGIWDAIHPSGPPRQVKPSGGLEGLSLL